MKPQIKLSLLAALLTPLCSTPLHAAETKADSDQRMAWWKEAKFGMFIHWGMFAVPAGIHNGKKSNFYSEWLMHRAKIPMAEYRPYAKEFNPVNYDPEAWVITAKNAGMKYIVITTKHHDGFALFDTKASDWNVVQASPYGKDLLIPLAEACRKHGIKLGFYYSQAQDWMNGGETDYGNNTPPWDPGQQLDVDKYIDTVAIPQVKELLTNYGEFPSLLWWDTPTGMTKERAGRINAAVQALRPGIIMNNRLGGGIQGDTETPEQTIPPQGFKNRNWETCMTMNKNWGFSTGDENWKPPSELIRNLCDIASKGGNYLLNVGPDAKGVIPQPSLDNLAVIGGWMKVNGEAIYGTQASPFPRMPAWGRCTTKALPDGNTRLFLHVFAWPADGRLVVSGLTNEVLAASLLAKPGDALAVKREASGAVIQLPEKAPDALPTVVVLDVVGAPVIEPFTGSAGADGVIALPAADATLDGQGLKLGNKAGGSFIGHWTNPADSVSFRVRFEKAGVQTIDVEWACTNAAAGSKTEFRLFDKDNKQVAALPWTVAATGSWNNFQTTAVGEIYVPSAGNFTLRLVALEKPGEAVANLSTIRLKAAN